MLRRLDKLSEDPWRDRERMRPIRRLEAELDRLSGGRGPWTGYPEVDAVRWMIEELRVSVWARTLGTPGPVSEAHVRRAIDSLSLASGDHRRCTFGAPGACPPGRTPHP